MVNLFNLIKESLNGNDNTKSSTRLQSYLVLVPVILTSFIFVIIEIVNAILTWNTGKIYSPTNQIIIAYSMILAHHISVLFSRQKSQKPEEPKPDEEIVKNDESSDTSNTDTTNTSEENQEEVK